jgi:predicted DCC family thiol-disulfide oxidoreductase YuxK
VNEEYHIILFDGLCNLCNGLIKFIIRHDHKKIFRFAALQSDAGQKLIKNCPEKILKADSIIYTNGLDYQVKSQAIFTIIKLIEGPLKLLLIFKIFPSFMSDFIYDRIAKIRYNVFGKRDVCMVPSTDISGRFLT